MSVRFTDIKKLVEHIKNNVDILKIIVEDLGRPPDKISGTNSFFNCPFHGDKNTPSFNVSTRINQFRCFGCNESGNIIKWVETWHGLSFIEAIQYLSAKYSVNIQQFIRQATAEEQIVDKYQSIYNLVAEFCLTKFTNNKQLFQAYLTDTGFEDDIIPIYKIGYSSSNEDIINYLFNKIPNITQDDIHKLELDNKNLFTNTYIYPILDISGQVSRIYARQHSIEGGKYIGTSTLNPLFKRDLVFGLYQIRKQIRNNKSNIIICEGFKAAIAANGVAIMGTSISIDQIKLLKDNGVKSCTLCFDGDQPGYIASMKAVEDSTDFTGLIVRIARLPMDMQCDTLVKLNGKQALDSILSSAQLPIEYIVSSKYNVNNKLTLESKYQLLLDIVPTLSKMSGAEEAITCSYLAPILETKSEDIREYIRNLRVTGSKLSNIDAEQSVLYYLLTDPVNWIKAKSYNLDDRQFTLGDNFKIYNAINIAYKEFNTAITAKLIYDKLSTLYPVDNVRLTELASNLVLGTPKYALQVACSLLSDLFIRRTTIQNSKELQISMSDLAQTPNEAVHKFRRTSVSLVETKGKQANDPLNVMDKVDTVIHERMQSGVKIIGFDFGEVLPVVNMVLSGLQPSHQLVISAQQGCGKSLCAANMLRPIIMKQRIPWLWINQEMNEVELGMRFISLESGINNTRLQIGAFKDNAEYLEYVRARDLYASGSLFIHKPRVGTIDEIYAIIEDYVFKHGIKGVTWDYVQLVSAARDQRGMSPTEVISEASNVMTNKVAKDLNLVSMCISQMNRSNYKKGEIREAENIGGAYKLAQDADDIITLSEKTAEQMEKDGRERGNRYLFIDKRRGGASNVAIHIDLDDRDTTSLRLKECISPIEMSGYSKAYGG